jgi:hypothetical protein
MVSLVRGVKKLLGADTSREDKSAAVVKKAKAQAAAKQKASAPSPQKRANQAADALGGMPGKAADAIRKRNAKQKKILDSL